jgi:hypothetical protein
MMRHLEGREGGGRGGIGLEVRCGMGTLWLEAEGEEQIGAMDMLSQGALWVVPGLLGFQP